MTTTSPPVEVIYTAPTGKRTAGRIHRATCRHIPNGATQLSAADAGVEALGAATFATCCSVRQADLEHALLAALAAEVEAAAPEKAEKATGTRRGALRDLVEAHLRSHPSSAFTPYQIGKALGRSSGAVTNALVTLAGLGVAEHVCDSPRTYRLRNEARNG